MAEDSRKPKREEPDPRRQPEAGREPGEGSWGGNMGHPKEPDKAHRGEEDPDDLFAEMEQLDVRSPLRGPEPEDAEEEAAEEEAEEILLGEDEEFKFAPGERATPRSSTSQPGSRFISPGAEEAYWRDHFRNRPYVDEDASYDEYQPAYQYGWEARGRYGPTAFDAAERELRTGWEKGHHRTMTWTRAREAVRDAWERVHRQERPGIDP